MSHATATPAPRQRKKPARFCRLVKTNGKAVLVIRQALAKGDQTDAYTLEPIPSDFGRGLLLHKHDGSSYAVNLSGPDSACDCLGHSRWNKCKHVSALLALQQADRL